MSFSETLKLEENDCLRFAEIEKKYRALRENPDSCVPMFIVNCPATGLPTFTERFDSPEAMLKAELGTLQNHITIGDDHLPIVRVQFGTAQVASAFGSEIHVFDDNLPAAKTHPLKDLQKVHEMKKPGLNAGLYEKVKVFTDYFKAHLPEGMHIQHPDIQSAFNSAHLIRGDEIFMDFYDDPEAVAKLLDLVTDYMLDLVPYLKTMTSDDKKWFYDWGALWQGTARISNCSMQMISPEFYMDYVFPRDIRFMQGIGGGRIHYCGRTREVVSRFMKVPGISAIDYDSNFHDVYQLCEEAPRELILFQKVDLKSDLGKRLLAGDWPKKRNLLFVTEVKTIEEGKEALKKLKESCPYT